MDNIKVRPLEKLTSRTKLDYCKLLSLMVIVDDTINQLKMAAFYRLVANIKLPSRKRELLIEFIFSEAKGDIRPLVQAVQQGLRDQERNILRFSLIKDLIIIKDADYIETQEENKLLEEMLILFDISTEQLRFIEEEVKKDEDFYDERDGGKASLIKDTMAKATAIGIPLAALYFSGSFRGLGPLGLMAGIMGIGPIKGKNKSHASGIIMTIIMGFTTYYLIKWLLHTKDRRETKLIDLYKEKMEDIHHRALEYVESDLTSILDKISDEENTTKLIVLQEIKDALEKTLGTLKHTKPTVI